MLIQAARAAQDFGHGNSGICYLIQHYVEMIRLLDAQTKRIMAQIRTLLKEQRDSLMAKQVQLLQTIPGVGFLSAVTLVCEIGDFSAFKRPKQLFAYFGLDPAVKQSGNFTGTDLKMSKRGCALRPALPLSAGHPVCQSECLRYAEKPCAPFLLPGEMQNQIQNDRPWRSDAQGL